MSRVYFSFFIIVNITNHTDTWTFSPCSTSLNKYSSASSQVRNDMITHSLEDSHDCNVIAGSPLPREIAISETKIMPTKFLSHFSGFSRRFSIKIFGLFTSGDICICICVISSDIMEVCACYVIKYNLDHVLHKVMLDI